MRHGVEKNLHELSDAGSAPSTARSLSSIHLGPVEDQPKNGSVRFVKFKKILTIKQRNYSCLYIVGFIEGTTFTKIKFNLVKQQDSPNEIYS